MLKYMMLLVLASANSMFSLIPGVELADDAGLLLLLFLLAYVLLKRQRLETLSNPYTWLIFFYFCLAAIQASQASLNYGQSMISGLMGVRHQLYYLSFFVFLLMFRDMQDIKAFLNLLAVTAVLLFGLALVNYIGPTILHHRWAEGHGMRGGVERGFIPGMDIVTVSLFWLSTAWGTLDGGRYAKLGALLLFAAHIFRQTRSRLVAAAAVIILILAYRKKYKSLIALAFAGALGVGVANIFLPEGYFYNLFVSGFTDVAEGEGSWDGRAIQMENVIEVFKEHPIFGSGSLALRKDAGMASLGGGDQNIALIARTRDLGYGHWIKAYGTVGLIWLLAYLYLIWRYAQEGLKKAEKGEDKVALFLLSYVLFILVTSITLNYFMIPARIILVCMAAAIAVRLHQLSGKADG